jgi:PPM family protein phosphatase
MTQNGFSWQRYLAVVAASDVGLRRANNQDSHGVAMAHDLAEWRERGHLFVVADGMGAHAAGELASKLAVDNVTHLYRKHREAAPPEAIRTAIEEANGEIHRRGQANISYHNMGTTCSTLLLLPQGAVIGHVGDSRVYVARSGWLQQLTFDHSLVWEIRQATHAGDADVIPGIPKNVITRSLGPQPTVQPDLEGPFPTDVGDTFLICSDGLTGRVSDEEIASFLTHCVPADAVDALVTLAVLRGGHDNITVILVRILSEQITAQGTRAGPLLLSTPDGSQRSISTGWWIGLGLVGLFAGTLAAIGQLVFAGIAGILFLILGFVLWGIHADFFGQGRTHLEGEARLGKGPYTKAKALSVEALGTRLQETILEALRQSQEMGWGIDGKPLEDAIRTAVRAVKGRRPEAALQELLNAARSLAADFREHARSRSASQGLDAFGDP